MPTVANASPLIALAAIDRLDLLLTLFGSVTIPPAVAAEIAPSIAVRPGTLGVLLAAKRHGLLGRVQPSLDALRNSGFFIGQKLYDEVLLLAGETKAPGSDLGGR